MEEMEIIKQKWILLLVLAVLAGSTTNVQAAKPYLIFHLDAVSSQDFFRELEAGNLPNIERLFAGGTQIKHGLSLYPGGTEMIYPRLKTGTGNHEGHSVGWGAVDPETGQLIPEPQILREMLSHFPRRSRGFFIYGVPGLHNLAALSLLNVPEILATYGYAEILWFITDVVGHLLGPDAHLKSLYSFDEAIGRFLPLEQLDDVNIILYGDHGMSFGEIELVDLKAILKSKLGSSFRFYSYPNVYLNEEVDRSAKARELVEAGIDFVFYREGDAVVGAHREGTVYFQGQDGLVRYSFSGSDPFGYYAAGYQGEAWSREEWLEFSRELRFPAVPPNVYAYLQNPYVGQFVLSLIPPKLPKTIRANVGNHAGLTTTDLLVPIMFKGPDLEHLRGLESMWLYELYAEHVPVDFSFVPPRDKNSLSLVGSPQGMAIRAELSPAYRVRSSLDLVGLTSACLGVEYDLFSTFLSRIWLGTGARLAGENPSLFLQGTYELTLGRVSASSRVRYHLGQSLELQQDVALRFSPKLSAVWQMGRGIGLRVTW